MKKIMCTLLCIIVLVGATACQNQSESGTSTQTDVLQPENVQKEIMYETDLDNIKKRYPNFQEISGTEHTTLVFEDKIGDIDGFFSIIVNADGKVEKTYFQAVFSYDEISEDNIKSITKNVYDSLTSRFGVTALYPSYAKFDATNVTQCDTITTLLEYENIVSPLYQGANSGYAYISFHAFTENANHYLKTSFKNNLTNNSSQLIVEMVVEHE